MKHRFTQAQFKRMVEFYALKRSGASFVVADDTLYTMLQTAFVRGANIDVVHARSKEKKDATK